MKTVTLSMEEYSRLEDESRDLHKLGRDLLATHSDKTIELREINGFRRFYILSNDKALEEISEISKKQESIIREHTYTLSEFRRKERNYDRDLEKLSRDLSDQEEGESRRVDNAIEDQNNSSVWFWTLLVGAVLGWCAKALLNGIS